MLNEARLLGHVGGDPELRDLANGDKVASFSLATSEHWKDRDGNRQVRTEWHRIVVFGPPVQIVERYVKKGSKLLVGGMIRTRKWQDNSGQDRYSTEIVLSGFGAVLKLLDKAEGGGAGRHDYNGYADGPVAGAAASAGAGSAGAGPGGGFGGDLDDDVPF